MKRSILFFLAASLLLIAAGVAAYPMIANYVNDKYQSTIRTEYVKELETLDDADIRAAKEAARAYNESLFPIRYDRDAVEAASVYYDDLLNLNGSGLMGYIEIPKIDVNLPIYHGTSEEVLQRRDRPPDRKLSAHRRQRFSQRSDRPLRAGWSAIVL